MRSVEAGKNANEIGGLTSREVGARNVAAMVAPTLDCELLEEIHRALTGGELQVFLSEFVTGDPDAEEEFERHFREIVAGRYLGACSHN